MSRRPDPDRTLSRGLRAAALVAAATLLHATSARADDAATSQPSDAPPPRRQYNYFSLERLDGAIEIGGEYQRNRVITGVPYQQGPFYLNSTRQYDSRATFQQQLLLDLDSTIYDPRFLRVSGSIGLGLQQERYRETFDTRLQTDSSNGYLSSYDLRAEFLPGKQVSGSAYALSGRDNYTRPFLPTLLEKRNDYGFALYYASDKLPMQLTYDHREVHREGDPELYEDEHLNQDRLAYQATFIQSPAHSLKFGYEYTVDDDRYSGSTYSFHNQRNEWRVDDELLFGDQRQHRLDTVLRFQDENGSYARDLYEMGTRMSLKHSDTLTTNYQYQFSKEEQGAIDFLTHRGDWQLVHQLYNNLTTTVDIFGLYQDVQSEGDTTQFGASVNWSYTRNNRFGRFSANLAVTEELEKTSGGGVRPIIGESASFIDPLPVTLINPNVVPTTIIVRDVARLRIFIPGIDYYITRVRNYTVLIRNPLGGIRNLATVYVDYAYSIDDDSERCTTLVSLNLQQDFNNGFTPYYILNYRNDDRDVPAYAYAQQNDTGMNRNRIGLRYRKDRFSAGAELDILQDYVDNFTAYHLYSTYGLVRKPGRTVDARADFSQYFFREAINGDSMVLELSLDGRAQFTRALEGYGTSTYRYEFDGARGRGVIQGVDLETGLSYRWGQMTITASIEYDLLNIVDSREDGFTAWLKVRRDFPDLIKLAQR